MPSNMRLETISITMTMIAVKDRYKIFIICFGRECDTCESNETVCHVDLPSLAAMFKYAEEDISDDFGISRICLIFVPHNTLIFANF